MQFHKHMYRYVSRTHLHTIESVELHQWLTDYLTLLLLSQQQVDEINTVFTITKVFKGYYFQANIQSHKWVYSVSLNRPPSDFFPPNTMNHTQTELMVTYDAEWLNLLLTSSGSDICVINNWKIHQYTIPLWRLYSPDSFIT